MSITNYPVSANRSAAMRETAQRPQWLDEELYPFQSRFVEIDGNRIHYIDEGTGPILFFLHPSIGWSFIYRDIIPRHRSVVMQGCHHFPQEYYPAGVATAIRRWWDEEIEP